MDGSAQLNRNSSKLLYTVWSSWFIWCFWMASCLDYMEKIFNATRSLLRNVKRYNLTSNSSEPNGPEDSRESRNSQDTTGAKRSTWSYLKKIKLKLFYYVSMKIYTINERALEIQQTELIISEILRENKDLIKKIQDDTRELIGD